MPRPKPLDPPWVTGRIDSVRVANGVRVLQFAGHHRKSPTAFARRAPEMAITQAVFDRIDFPLTRGHVIAVRVQNGFVVAAHFVSDAPTAEGGDYYDLAKHDARRAELATPHVEPHTDTAPLASGGAS